MDLLELKKIADIVCEYYHSGVFRFSGCESCPFFPQEMNFICNLSNETEEELTSKVRALKDAYAKVLEDIKD